MLASWKFFIFSPSIRKVLNNSKKFQLNSNFGLKHDNFNQKVSAMRRMVMEDVEGKFYLHMHTSSRDVLQTPKFVRRWFVRSTKERNVFFFHSESTWTSARSILHQFFFFHLFSRCVTQILTWCCHSFFFYLETLWRQAKNLSEVNFSTIRFFAGVVPRSL